MEEERFDNLFLSVAQQSQGVEPMLDAVFGFLRRRTDFFVGASTDKVEELVLATVRKHAALAERDLLNAHGTFYEVPAVSSGAIGDEA